MSLRGHDLEYLLLSEHRAIKGQDGSGLTLRRFSPVELNLVFLEEPLTLSDIFKGVQMQRYGFLERGFGLFNRVAANRRTQLPAKANPLVTFSPELQGDNDVA